MTWNLEGFLGECVSGTGRLGLHPLTVGNCGMDFVTCTEYR